MKTLARVHHSSSNHWVGNGFPVRSVFDYNGLGRELNPFLLLDYAAPHVFAPGTERRGVGSHPHKGFETVTVVYQGELEHRDSSGGGGTIGPGDVQWMTAGNGIIHEEFHSESFTRKGGTLQMVQLWVNLRAKDKKAKARYQTLLQKSIPKIDLPVGAGQLRVIAGEYKGQKGAAETFSPIQLWDLRLSAGSTIELPATLGHVTAFLAIEGLMKANESREVAAGDLAIFSREGSGIQIAALQDSKLLYLGAEPFDEPMIGQGPFVMNNRTELQQAFEDYQMGKLGELPAQ